MERRRKKRYSIREAVEFREIAGTTGHSGYLENCCEDGLCIASATPVEPGDLINIKVRDLKMMGEVRYCNRNGVGFQFGLMLPSGMEEGVLESLLNAYLTQSAASHPVAGDTAPAAASL